MDTVTEGGVTLADNDWDLLSRRDLVKLDNNALTSNPDYEEDDDLSSLVHTGPAPLTFTLGRNHSSQITSLAASDGAFLSRPASTTTSAYVPNKLNQYSTVGGVAQGYDANANLTSDGTFTFEYDEENRLRSATGAGTTAAYEYDPVGRRRAKVVNSVTTKFASDGAEEIEERDGSNNVLRKYVYGSGIDDRIAMLDSTACAGGGRCFYLTNWQGSTTTLVNQSGTLNATYHYGPYGEGTNWTPADALTGNPFRYTGRRVDPETGLYYYRARYYSPTTGRFLQTDPIGTKDDLNLYAFTRHDPLNHFDPNGEDSIAVQFRDQPVHAGSHVIPQWISGGHSGVVTINERNGLTHYYEFGRYAGGSQVRQLGLPDLKFNNGVPTLKSVEAVLGRVLDIGVHANSRDIGITFDAGTDFQRMENYVTGVRQDDPAWTPWGTNCHGFCEGTTQAGGGNGPRYSATLTRANLAAVAGQIIAIYQQQQQSPQSTQQPIEDQCSRNPLSCNPGHVR
ncbi:MAG TPA: RHS repeat-associated core domain-containing protein [Steroidobacteraceae bacterium]|nr:RHS repeat-associated core domain-containing protein [Steroidobacteraceae bacterium]